jgi:hypothetical protein
MKYEACKIIFRGSNEIVFYVGIPGPIRMLFLGSAFRVKRD